MKGIPPLAATLKAALGASVGMTVCADEVLLIGTGDWCPLTFVIPSEVEESLS